MSNDSLISHFEQQLLELTRTVLARYQKGFKQTGLTATVKKTNQLPLLDPGYFSEIVIEFHYNKTLVDILEFFAWKEGMPYVSLKEAEEWLNLSVQDVIEKQRERAENWHKVAV